MQQEIVNGLLAMSTGQREFKDSVDKRVCCPHCQAQTIRANGTLKGVQRYVCNGCGKNFSQTTGKFWYNIKKKDKISRYLHCLLSGFSIRKSAQETGISIQTSFDWRHKLLVSFGGASAEEFRGIVESDDLFFTFSEKGKRGLERPARHRGGDGKKPGISEDEVAVIATCDRSGNKDFKVATRGRISKKDLDKALGGKLGKAEALCSDSHRSYGAFARGQQITHKKFNASSGSRTVEKVYHVQNVNNMDMRLRKFMAQFNGVATKYLQNYLNWFLALEKIKKSTERMASLAAIAFASNTVWFTFKETVMGNMLFRT